jgi:hypothetical protein
MGNGTFNALADSTADSSVITFTGGSTNGRQQISATFSAEL